MKRNPRHHLLAAVQTFLALIAIATLPIVGVANAASTTCEPPPPPPTFFCEVDCPPPPPSDPKCAQPVAPCPDGNLSCDQEFSGSGSAATLFANDGTPGFIATFHGLLGNGCGDGGPKDTNGVLDFTYTGNPNTKKTIVIALRRDLVTKGIGQYNICWISDKGFTQIDGSQAPPVDSSFCGLTSGACFAAYLPACKKNDDGPCVLFKMSGQYNVAYFGILAPPGDPQAYPGV